MTRSCNRSKIALNVFRVAEREVVAAGYAWEAKWQRTRAFSTFSESELLREAAWVILCSGFREASVRRWFDYISLCFCDWHSALEIAQHRNACVQTALSAFRHEKKINAIAHVAEIICEQGFNQLRCTIQKQPIPELQRLPYVGPVTSWHLAKNLGLSVAKNDRHLARLAELLGYSDAHHLCDAISDATGEPASVVDIVLWRYASMSAQPAAIAY